MEKLGYKIEKKKDLSNNDAISYQFCAIFILRGLYKDEVRTSSKTRKSEKNEVLFLMHSNFLFALPNHDNKQ